MSVGVVVMVRVTHERRFNSVSKLTPLPNLTFILIIILKYRNI